MEKEEDKGEEEEVRPEEVTLLLRHGVDVFTVLLLNFVSKMK